VKVKFVIGKMTKVSVLYSMKINQIKYSFISRMWKTKERRPKVDDLVSLSDSGFSTKAKG